MSDYFSQFVADTKRHAAEAVAHHRQAWQALVPQQIPRMVFLIFMHDACIMVCGSLETARAEAAKVRNCYAGPWAETREDHWQSDLIQLLMIEAREVR